MTERDDTIGVLKSLESTIQLRCPCARSACDHQAVIGMIGGIVVERPNQCFVSLLVVLAPYGENQPAVLGKS